MSERRLTQITIGILFSFFLLISIFFNFVIMFSNFRRQSSYDITIIILFVFFISFLLSMIKEKIGMIMQVILILLISYVCFIFNGEYDFFSWGFLLLFIILSYHYGFLENYIYTKFLIFLLSFIVVISVTAYVHKNPFIVVICLIYFCCVFFFCCFIFRKIVYELFHTEKQIADLQQMLCIKEQELEQAKINSKVEELSFNNYLELVKRIQCLEEENNKLKLNITTAMGNYLNKKEQLFEDKDNLSKIIEKLFPVFNSKEKRVLIDFYLSNGSKTNNEIAYDLGTTEQTVKNAFRKIFNELQIKSRAEVLVKLDTVLSSITNEYKI